MIHDPSPRRHIARPDAGPAIPGDVARAGVLVMGPDGVSERIDRVAIEEPLEIRASGPDQAPVSVAVTMRTPGHDRELAVGFLYTEGLIQAHGEVVAGQDRIPGRKGGVCNVVRVALSRPFDGSSLKRNFFATSSCGLCGKATLDQVAVRCPPVAPGLVVGRSVRIGLPDALRKGQTVFDRRGACTPRACSTREAA